MFLTELFEQQTTKHAAFCFGRMNPPTVGHAQLINTVAKASQDGDYFVFVSQTQDKKKNPLDYNTKVQFIKALFPKQASHIVYNPELKTIMQVATWLYNKGYRSVTFVAGSDRLASFQELLTKYNGQEDSYNFTSINFVSSGERDPDADGIAGVSASSAREAASNGNFEAFAQATGAGKLAKPLYNAVRKGMMLTDLELAESADTVIPHYLYKWVDGPQFQKYIDAGKLPVKRKYAHYIDAVNKLVAGNSFTDEAHINKWAGNTLIRIDTSKLSNNIYPIPGNRTYLKTMGMTNSSYDPTSYKYESEEIDEYWIEGPVDISSAEIVQGKAAQPELDEGWKDAAIGAAMLGTIGGAMYAQPHPKVEIDGVKWTLTSRTPGILAHAKVVTAADGKQYQVWRGPKNRHLAHPIDNNPTNEDASGYIPKNKKEAKDPRWSNALTVDVHPDTPYKNARALRLV
jgi:hypothetical protein